MHMHERTINQRKMSLISGKRQASIEGTKKERSVGWEFLLGCPASVEHRGATGQQEGSRSRGRERSQN